MKTMIEPQSPMGVWEDLVADFLEMASCLVGASQKPLLHELRMQSTQCEAIQAYRAFSLDGKLVIVCSRDQVQECWIYDPDSQALAKTRPKFRKISIA